MYKDKPCFKCGKPHKWYNRFDYDYAGWYAVGVMVGMLIVKWGLL